jgi:enamine deaminase RidA (YjgF/YER057c/UK114 family)
MIERFEPGPRMSKMVRTGGLLFMSGQLDRNKSPNVTDQTRVVLQTIDDLLKHAGSDKSKLVSASIWLSDMRNFDAMNAVWDAWVDPLNPPTRATVEARLSSADYLVEIAVIAADSI